MNIHYKFLQNNISLKRQKIGEDIVKSTEFDDNFRHYLPSMSTASSDIKKHDIKMLHNLQLKRLEDKPSRLNIEKDLDQ